MAFLHQVDKALYMCDTLATIEEDSFAFSNPLQSHEKRRWCTW